MADEHLQHLMKLIEAKQVYTSYALLKKIPADTYIPGKQKIIDELKDALIKGKAIHAILQNSRNNGDYPTAFKQSQKLQKIVPDYPNLKHDIIAIENTLKKLDPIISQAKIAASHGKKDEAIKLLQTVRQIHAKHPEIPLIEKIARRRAYGKSAKSIIISIFIIAIPSLLFGLEKIMISQAEDSISNASRAIAANKFKLANENIAKMYDSLRYVYVFDRIKKEQLTARAKTMQSSLTFIQGMRGRVSHEGEFISEKKKNIIDKLERLLIDAAQFIEQDKWQEALHSYNKALEFIKRHEAEVGSEQENITSKIAELEIIQAEHSKQLNIEECKARIQLVDMAFTNRNWPQTIERYKEAYAYAKNFNIIESCLSDSSLEQYNTALLSVLLDKGQTLQDQNNPVAAVDYYTQALQHATSSTMNQSSIDDIQIRIENLKEQVFMSRVHLLIKEGDDLLQNNDLPSALSKYNFALTMLESHPELIHGKDKLHASLSQTIQQVEKTASLAAQRKELETLAEPTLRKYFDLSPANNLEKTTITLTEQQENLFTYCISAYGVRDKIKYELFYQFDANSNSWKIVK